MDTAFIDTIETGFRALAPRLRELGDRFYAHLFSRVPGLREKFPRDLNETKQRLGSTINLVVRHMRAPDALRGPLLRLGHEHAACGMSPDDYVLVRDVLVDILAEMLAPNWNEHTDQAWRRAINYATAVMSEGMCEPTLQ